MARFRHDRTWLTAAAVVAVVGLLVVMAVVAVVKAPAPQPVAQAQPWCVDPVSMTLFAEQRCTEDLDLDGFHDGVFYVPVRGLAKPVVGGKLPSQVKFARPVHELRVPVKKPPAVEQKKWPGPVSPAGTEQKKWPAPVSPPKGASTGRR